jgi:hypothetical protein
MQLSGSNIQAAILPLMINGCPELCYVLTMMYNANNQPTNNLIRSYVYGFETKQWMRLAISNGQTGIATANLITTVALALSNIVTIATPDNISFTGVVMALQVPGQVPSLRLIPQDVSNTSTIGTVNQSQMTFPAARIQTDKDITIDAIIINATGANGTTIKATVDDVVFGLITLSDTQPKNMYRIYPADQIALTTRQPQLQIQASGAAAIGEISMYGSAGPGRRP